MQDKILYILGAGASAGNKGLPTITDLPSRMRGCIESIKSASLILKPGADNIIKDKSIIPFINECLNDIESVAKNALKFVTVDTYAKHIYLTKGPESKEYISIKRSLIIYFLYEQFVEKKI